MDISVVPPKLNAHARSTRLHNAEGAPSFAWSYKVGSVT